MRRKALVAASRIARRLRADRRSSSGAAAEVLEVGAGGVLEVGAGGVGWDVLDGRIV